MSTNLKQKILSKTTQKPAQEFTAEIVEDFKLKTAKKNQLLAFFKPEAFEDKTTEQTEKILNLAFEKMEAHDVEVDGAALYPGPSVGKYSIMDRHYGVINTLSKNASKILNKDERDLVFATLGIKDQNTKILGGHEAYEISGFGKTYDFDNYWLEAPSTKIKSGFYVRTMKIAGKEAVVVNGFHPHQLAHFTDKNSLLAVMLVSSNTPWARLRVEMLGETFPEKAIPSSIRGSFYANPREYGFERVTIANNVMHLSAGPTEALFEINNFFKEPFGIDFIKGEAKLARKITCGRR